MLPALAVGLVSVYSAFKTYDTIRYWSDYSRNSGYSPRYPFARANTMGNMVSTFSHLKKL